MRGDPTPWGPWGRERPDPALFSVSRSYPAMDDLFPPDPQMRLFELGEIPWFDPHVVNGRQVIEFGEPMFILNRRVAQAWNEQWRGRKVRVLSGSGVTEGYCAGVGPGFGGPTVKVNTSPGSSLNIDPRGVVRITEIDHFDGEDAWRDEDDEHDLDGEEAHDQAVAA